jgi:hypothetical protein
LRAALLRALAALLVALPVPAPAQSPSTGVRDRAADAIDFDADKDKAESEATLPPAPQAANLIRFDPGRPGSMSYFIDAASLSVSADGIVRFTSIAKGEGASQNVAYEGIRCATRERKTYAYGRSDGSWSALRDPQWSTMRGPSDGYRFALYQDYFCPSRGIIRSPEEGIAALKRGGHPRAGDFSRVDPFSR